jgi:hypothetical protein
MTKELRRALPKRVFYHEDFGWLNHQSYYEAAIDMQVFARIFYSCTFTHDLGTLSMRSSHKAANRKAHLRRYRRSPNAS